MRTPLCDLLGIEVPIILAPIIAPVGAPAGPRLAAAVSEAGGLGTIALWLAEIDVLRLRIREMNSLTSKPFAINLRLDLDAGARLDACLGEGVRIVSMFWGDPSKLAPRAKAGGAIVMQTVRSAEEARIAVDCGVMWSSLKAGKRAVTSGEESRPWPWCRPLWMRSPLFR